MSENMEMNIPMEQQEAPMTMDAPQDGAIALSEFFEQTSSAADQQPMGDQDEQPQEMDAQEQTQEPGTDYSVRTRENKGVRGKYLEDVRRGVEAQLAQERASMMETLKAEFRQQFDEMMAPMREAQVEQEAQKLIASKKISDPELAREYARMRLGIPTQTEQPKTAEQPTERSRDAQGRFVSPQNQQPSGDIQARAQMLGAQAEQIRRDYGLDMIGAFSTDPVVREKVGRGDWDFRDAALYMSRKPADNSGNRQPVAVRSPNNTRPKSRFSDMSDDEFDRFEKSIANGARYDLRR